MGDGMLSFICVDEGWHLCQQWTLEPSGLCLYMGFPAFLLCVALGCLESSWGAFWSSGGSLRGSLWAALECLMEMLKEMEPLA